MWIGQGLEQNRVQCAENRGGGTDAKSQRQCGRSREARAFAKHAKSKADVGPRRFQNGDAAAVAVALFGLLDAAQLDEGIAAGGPWRHSGAEVVFDVHLEMGLQLLRQIGVTLLFSEKALEPLEPCPDPSHEAYSFLPNFCPFVLAFSLVAQKRFV